jgi:serine/threonine-protein kinase
VIGRTLGRFRIVARLGAGGMGTVWRAEDPTLGRSVALKLPSSGLWTSEEDRQRFLREARTASRLDHPGIATVYDVGETEGVAWIATQFIDGETVAARTERGPLPLAEARDLAVGIADALAHAHERDVLHRDVTAGNVLVTREGRPVLVDFGLARPERGTHLATTGGGTAGYMAPEVIRGETADARADLYGLGVVLYRMLTGRLPFAGSALDALTEPAPRPSDLRPEIPPAFEHVVLRLLERDPADRYARATEVAEALRQLEPGRGTTPWQRARRALGQRWRRARQAARRVGRARIGLATLAAVAVLAGATWLATKQGWVPGMAREAPVLAVLPFENTSADPEEIAYVGEGLGDEMVLKLAQGSGYRVLPWTTTRRLANSGESIPQQARRLKAQLVLVGTFRAENNRIRVTASLVDGRSGVQRWSRSFDALLDDLMSVQSKIATGVAEEIAGTLNPEERRALSHHPSVSPAAYAHYLQGAQYLQSMDPGERALALPFFDRAIQLDATLAEAYVGRGAANLDLHFRGTAGGIESVRSAQEDFRTALGIDPGLMRARRGLITAAYELGHPEDGLQVAAALPDKSDTNIEALLVRGWACMFFGFTRAGMVLFERVLELDPSNQEAAWFLVVTSQWGDQHARTLAAGKDYIQRFGEDPEIYLWLGVASAQSGREHDATLYMTRALALMGDDSSNLYGTLISAAHFRKTGDLEHSRRLSSYWVPILRERATRFPDNYRILSVLAGLEGIAGDVSSMRQHLGEVASHVRENRDYTSNALIMVIPGVIAAGDLADLELVATTARGSDLGNLHELNTEWAGDMTGYRSLPPGDPRVAVYTRLQNDVRRRIDELAGRYLPAIVLRGRSL